jgi:hypothetical protein
MEGEIMGASSRRRGISPVPEDLESQLNAAQRSELHKVEEFGWKVKFVRRAMVVLVYKDGSTMGVLEEDGSLNHQAAIRERGEPAPAPSLNMPQETSPNRFIT